jgi:hypothetical protein
MLTVLKYIISKKLFQNSVLVMVLFQLPLYAQLNNSLSSIKFADKEISVNNEELANLTVKVKNDSKMVLNAVANVNTDNEIDLISKKNFAISINPGDSLYMPIKIFISKKAQSGMLHLVRFVLKDSLQNIIGSDSCELKISIKKNVIFYAQVSSVLLENNTDSIRIPVRVVNMGNTTQKISLIAGYPSSVDLGDFQKASVLVVKPLKDTTIVFTKAVNRSMFTNQGFDVNITGLYSNGELFNMAYIKIQNARNSRTYRDQNYNDSYENNSLSLSSMGVFSPNESYLMQGRGTLGLPEGKISYNLDATMYKNVGYSPAIIRNTYISYEALNMGLKAGNINKNMDINLNGKGGEFFLNDTAARNQYIGGYINSSSNLLGESYKSVFSPGKAAWGSFIHTARKWQLNSGAIYELNPFLGVRNMLLSNLFRLKQKDFRYLFTLNSGRVSGINSERVKFGFAAGVDIVGSIKDFSLNSTNYFSTGYYPGLRQGALSFSERVTYNRPKGNLWASMEYYDYKPQNISSTILFNPTYNSLRLEAGISKKIFGKITLSFAPYFTSDKNNSFQFLDVNAPDASLNSFNIGTTLNVPISSSQYFSLNTESGYYSSSVDASKRFHFRSNSNYRYKYFNLSTAIQKGSFYINEAINDYQKKVSGNYIINITPSVQHVFLHNKLKTNLGISYSNTKFTGKGLQLTGRTEYEIIPKTIIFASVNHNRYTFINDQYNSSVFEIGITKKLRNGKIEGKSKFLEIFVFKDINQNGIYDHGDSTANNHLIYIDDIIFLTKPDGTVRYKNLPTGDYRISLPKTRGWYAPDQMINFNQKERIEIPLQKTGTLKGRVSYSFNEYSYEINERREGLMINAIGENGQKYVTKTNIDGSYIFFMPVGKYVVSIDRENLPAEVENKLEYQQTEIVPGEIKSLDLVLNVKQRKIETKRFVSPSLRK